MKNTIEIIEANNKSFKSLNELKAKEVDYKKVKENVRQQTSNKCLTK